MSPLHLMARLVNRGSPLCGAPAGGITKDPKAIRGCNDCAAFVHPKAVSCLAEALFGWLP